MENERVYSSMKQRFLNARLFLSFAIIVQPAFYISGRGLELRGIFFASIHSMGTPVVESTAFRRVEQGRWSSIDEMYLFLFGSESRYRRDERLCVRMFWGLVNVTRRPHLNQ